MDSPIPKRRFLGAPISTCRNAVGLVLRGLIRGYRLLLSPLLPMSCRFAPSCAAYAEEAILHHGPLRGCWLALRRLLRCHPWGASGFDPVPQPTLQLAQQSAPEDAAVRHSNGFQEASKNLERGGVWGKGKGHDHIERTGVDL